LLASKKPPQIALYCWNSALCIRQETRATFLHRYIAIDSVEEQVRHGFKLRALQLV